MTEESLSYRRIKVRDEGRIVLRAGLPREGSARLVRAAFDHPIANDKAVVALVLKGNVKPAEAMCSHHARRTTVPASEGVELARHALAQVVH